MNKSIIILGKGPSLLRCTKEFVDQYDDIAICGFPPFTEDFLKLINNRKIKYHFCNCGDPHLTKDNKPLYSNEINKQYKIENIHNINSGVNKYSTYLNNKNIFKENLKDTFFDEFKVKYNFDKWGPSCGIYGFHYIISLKKYNKISLVGFDNFEQGKQRYYFHIKHYNPSLLYLIGRRDISNDNKTIKKTLHDQEKTIKYLSTIFNNNKSTLFELYSNIKFNKSFDNLIIL